MSTLRQAVQAAHLFLVDLQQNNWRTPIKQVMEQLATALAEPQPEQIRWNFPIFSEWWDAHGRYSESGSRDLAKLAWEVSRERVEQPQPVHECADNDSPWLVCKPCAADGKCKQAEPQPKPGAQSRTIREIICYIRENDLGSIGDEWIAALQVPQAQQPRFVKPWQERLPCSPMNCSASEVVAAKQAEIDEWRNGQAQRQPLTDEQIGEILHGGDFTGTCAYRRFARAIEAAHGIGGK